MRELYFYWHADTPQGARALEAVAAAQREWQARWPGLQARLLKRAEGPRTTWMEIYASPGGIDDALQAMIVAEGDARLAPWIDGRRHLEVFEPVTPAAPTATPVAPAPPAKRATTRPTD